MSDPENIPTTRISADRAVKEAGYDDVHQYLLADGLDSVILACCNEGCEVEPDGRCEHGNPSVLLALGLI
jgi:hypothetical protein